MASVIKPLFLSRAQSWNGDSNLGRQDFPFRKPNFCGIKISLVIHNWSRRLPFPICFLRDFWILPPPPLLRNLTQHDLFSRKLNILISTAKSAGLRFRKKIKQRFSALQQLQWLMGTLNFICKVFASGICVLTTVKRPYLVVSKIPHHHVISTMTSLESVQKALERKRALPMPLILDTFATPCLPMLGVFFKIVVFKEGGHSVNIYAKQAYLFPLRMRIA